MRLLFVNDRLTYTSSAFYSLDLAEALIARGDQVRICARGGELLDVFKQRDVRAYTVKLNLFSFRKLIGFLRDFSPDLVHILDVASLATGRRLSVKLDVPHVITVHQAPAEPDAGLAHRLLAGVVAASEMIRAALVNEQGIPKNLIRVVEHGVNVDAFSPDAHQPSERAASSVPVIGSVGRLTRVKGHDVFLRAARLSVDRGVDAMFMIVGEGEEEQSLHRMVRDLDLVERVTFLPHMPRRRDLYRIFDVVVVPPLRGGVGSTVLEAMATGKPVIATAVGEMLQMIQNGKTGLLVEEANAEALADGIVKLVRDPEYAAELGRVARQVTCERYPLSEMVRSTREFYEAVQVRLHEQSLEG